MSGLPLILVSSIPDLCSTMKDQGLSWQLIYPLVYFPQMCSMKTEAMKMRDMTKTGTGPTLIPGESSV